MDSQAFIEMCTEDVHKNNHDLGEFEAYCWEQLYVDDVKKTKKVMSCAIVFKEIAFVYHDDFSYSCKNDEIFKQSINKNRYIPTLKDIEGGKVKLIEIKKPIKMKEENLKDSKIVSVTIDVNHEDAKKLFEVEKQKDAFAKRLNYEEWVDSKKWEALKDKMNEL